MGVIVNHRDLNIKIVACPYSADDDADWLERYIDQCLAWWSWKDGDAGEVGGLF